MKTIIFDIDGTLTNMKPIEKLSLSDKAFYGLLKKEQLPIPKKYPLVNWIIKNKNKYRFIYATGGKKIETEYVLKKLNILNYFDLKNSMSKTNCSFSKKTGVPFKKIKSKFDDCILITDSKNDCLGAKIAGIPFILVNLNNQLNIILTFSQSCNFINTEY